MRSVFGVFCVGFFLCVSSCFFEAKLSFFAGYVIIRQKKGKIRQNSSNLVKFRQKKSGKVIMPLTQKVTFQTVLEKGNRIQVPKLIRWQFKIEDNQVLRVGINAVDTGRGWQFFYTKMAKDGRIHITKLIVLILQGEKPSLQGYLLEITLEPT